jgi:hypothetical protein
MNDSLNAITNTHINTRQFPEPRITGLLSRAICNDSVVQALTTSEFNKTAKENSRRAKVVEGMASRLEAQSSSL